MILLSDNDIVYKLAAFDLFDEALAALEIEAKDVFVLPTARFKFGIGTPKGEKRYGPTLIARMAAVLARVREIGWITSPPRELLGVLSIDQGEALLFAAAQARPDAYLATGDKRSLKALVAEPACKAIAEALRGRLLSFESIVLRLIDRHGFELVRDRIAPVSATDKAMDVVFGSGLSTTAANARAGLESYVRELRALPIDLLGGRSP